MVSTADIAKGTIIAAAITMLIILIAFLLNIKITPFFYLTFSITLLMTAAACALVAVDFG